MRTFQIVIGHRDSPRLSFPAMAPDAMTAREQHEGLREENERLEVRPDRRCYVCGALPQDDCHGIGGEVAECPR